MASKKNNDEIDAVMFLPVEMIWVILSRLPVKSLARFTCVCKLWNTVIHDRKFFEMHRARSRMIFEYTEKSEIMNDNSNQETFQILHVRDGLLLEGSKPTGKYRIRNPTTNYSLPLPDLQVKYRIIKMFYLPNTDDYKLVCVYYKKGDENGGCEVLTVGTDFTWKALDSPFHNLGSHGEGFSMRSSDGAFFVCRFSVDGSGVSEIVCLEIETEKFFYNKIPQADCFRNLEDVEVFIWDDKLSLAKLVEQELLVWIQEDYKKEIWSQRKIVIPNTLFGKYPHTLGTLHPYSCSKTSWFWFRRIDDNSFVAFNLESKLEYIMGTPSGKKILYCIIPSLLNLKRSLNSV